MFSFILGVFVGIISTFICAIVWCETPREESERPNIDDPGFS